jgi:hypothetical protein
VVRRHGFSPLYDGSSRLRTRDQRNSELSELFNQQFKKISKAKEKSADTLQWIGRRSIMLWVVFLNVAELAMAVAANNDRFVSVRLSGNVMAF